jgi:hypothetical protein
MMNELTTSTAPLTGIADLLVHQLANHNAMAHYDFRQLSPPNSAAKRSSVPA